MPWRLDIMGFRADVEACTEWMNVFWERILRTELIAPSPWQFWLLYMVRWLPGRYDPANYDAV
jgi:hypothetical protein